MREEIAAEAPAAARPLEDRTGFGIDRARASSRPHATAFENIALAHREIYALYEIAQSMGTSLGVADTMALISSKLTKIIPWSGCALFLQQPDGETAQVPLRGRRGCAAAAERDRSRPNRGWRAGWPATAARSSTRTRASTFEAVGLEGELSLQSAIVCPLYFGDALHRVAGALPHRAEPLHRGSPPADRARRRAGRRRHPQLDRVRADAGRVADRSADLAAQPPVDVRAPRRASWRGPSASSAKSA